MSTNLRKGIASLYYKVTVFGASYSGSGCPAKELRKILFRGLKNLVVRAAQMAEGLGNIELYSAFIDVHAPGNFPIGQVLSEIGRASCRERV